MPTTNRPFFFHFLAAFRAQSALSKSSTTTSSTSTSTATASSYAPPTLSRAIATKSPGATTAAVHAANPSLSHAHPRQPSTSPSSSSAARSPPPAPPPPPPPPTTPRSPQAMSPTSSTSGGGGAFGRARRRGSDTSSEGGFRDLGEKWYVGGKTPSGEERFLRLGMVRKERSGDRLSLDRLSL